MLSVKNTVVRFESETAGVGTPSLTVLPSYLSLSQSGSATWMWTEKLCKYLKPEDHIINLEFRMM